MKDFKGDSQFSSDVLGYCLGLHDEATRRELESRYGGDPRWQAASQSIANALAPLKADALDAPGDDFVDRILERVEAGGKVLPFPRGALAAPPGQTDFSGGNSLFSIRELTGVAAAILMFAGIFVPGYYSARQSAQRIACAHNLRQVGSGIVQYAELNGDQIPFAGFAPADAMWASTRGEADAHVMRNSRHAYLMVRGRQVSPEAFHCPGAANDFPMYSANSESFDDFQDPRNNSFATNMMTRPWDRYAFVPQMPMAACMTPLVDENRRLLPPGADVPNSSNHGRAAGQNVLRADMSVSFFTSPACGPADDDIYRARGVSEHHGNERPRQRDDALLVP